MKSTIDMQVFERLAAYSLWRQDLDKMGGAKPLVGFVPTMGALHEGHLELMAIAGRECERTVVSIFVNPLQFGPNEDYQRYPRPLENDLELCRQQGVHAVFHPLVEEFYSSPLEQTTRVVPPETLVDRLCGKFRPGHFSGVATVVLKLFGCVSPTIAYFGEKDYQQLTIVKRMVADLNVPVQVKGVPIVRETDGLAMSSRNVYLSAESRAQAPLLYQTLCQVRDRALPGAVSLAEALAEGRQALSAFAGLTLQYLEACHPDTLEPLAEARPGMVILVAVKLGDVRLIDNLLCK